MKSTELAELVKKMRAAQKEYFRAKWDSIEKNRWLEESKRLEKEVDAAVEDILKPKLF